MRSDGRYAIQLGVLDGHPKVREGLPFDSRNRRSSGKAHFVSDTRAFRPAGVTPAPHVDLFCHERSDVTMNRKLKIAALASVALVVAACGSSNNSGKAGTSASATASTTGTASSQSAGSPASGQQSPGTTGTIKIGFLDTISGPAADVGQLALMGAKIAVDQWNAQGGVLGKKIELVVKDEQLSPTKTVQNMRDYSSAGINLITGFTSSADVLAAKPIAEQNNMVIVTSGTTDTSLTTTQHSANVYEVAANTRMMNVAAAHLAATEWKDATRWDGVNFDYVTGHDAWSEFQQLLKTNNTGATTGKAVFVPQTASQDTAYINSLLAANPSPKNTGLYYFLYGGGAVQFAKQALPLKLFDQYKFVAGVGSGEEFSAALGAQGPHIYFVHDYFWDGYHNDLNTYLINEWKKLPQQPGLNLYGPHEWTYEGFTSVTAILDALKDAGSTDSNAVKKSLSSINFMTPMGEAHFASSNILAAPVTVWQCQGDSSQKYGYRCFGAESVPPSITLAGK